MLIKYISQLAFLQFIIAVFIWFFLFFLLERYLKSRYHLDYSSIKFFTIYYILLSIVAIIRIFLDILPTTADSFLYLSIAEEIEGIKHFQFLGPHVYGDFIYMIKTLTFNNYYTILFLNNIIFIIALVNLMAIIPYSTRRGYWIWFGFLLVYPSIYWFIPNTIRESLFIYFTVKILMQSIFIIRDRITIKQLGLLLFYCSFSVILRPQTLPIIFIWLIFVFVKKHFKYGILVMLVGLLFLNKDYVQQEIIRKVSFEYIEAFKTEATSSISFIAFKELIIPSNLMELLTLSPYLTFRFLFSPFPWELSNLKYTFAFVDALLMIIIFILLGWMAIKGLVWNWDVVLFSFLFIVIIGVFEIAFSGAVRHRMPYILILSSLLLKIPSKKCDTVEQLL